MEFAVFQFLPIDFCLVTRHHWGESGSVFLTPPPHQIFVHIDEIHSEPSFLQVEQFKLSSLSLYILVPSSFLCLFTGPTPVYPGLLCAEEPRTGPSTPVVFHQCWADGSDHSPQFAGNTSPHTAQDTVGHLCHKGSALAHVQLLVCHNPQILLFCSCQPPACTVHGVVLPQG